MINDSFLVDVTEILRRFAPLDDRGAPLDDTS